MCLCLIEKFESQTVKVKRERAMTKHAFMFIETKIPSLNLNQGHFQLNGLKKLLYKIHIFTFSQSCMKRLIPL